MAISAFSQIGISTDVQIIGDTLVVASATPVYFGSPTANGSYRIIRDGNNLNIERRESGLWVAKEYTMP